MSITVNIYYSGENGAARRFAQEMLASGTVEQCRQEKGNLKDEFFYPVSDPETVLLMDRSGGDCSASCFSEDEGNYETA